jgi:hypothetical protein
VDAEIRSKKVFDFGDGRGIALSFAEKCNMLKGRRRRTDLIARSKLFLSDPHLIDIVVEV